MTVPVTSRVLVLPFDEYSFLNQREWHDERDMSWSGEGDRGKIYLVVQSEYINAHNTFLGRLIELKDNALFLLFFYVIIPKKQMRN